MPEPMTCQLRRTRIVGPMHGCRDLECFEACVGLTRKERELGAVSYRYQEYEGELNES